MTMRMSQETARPTGPVLNYPPELLLKAQEIKLVFFDVDGVMTDGGLYLSAEGETLKRFNTLDGYGIKQLHLAGIVPVVITGRDAEPLRHRLHALGVRQARYSVEDKGAACLSVLGELGMGWSQAAAMGDDWPDLPMMRRCAFAAAPRNAHAEVIAMADYVSPRSGGAGAVRDMCDLLLVAGGHYARLYQLAAA